MAVSLTIDVPTANTLLTAGYTHIKIYRSTSETIGFSEITSSSSRVALQLNVTSYQYTDKGGTVAHWYLYTFYGSAVTESVISAAFQGEYIDTSFSPITYPVEMDVSVDDRFVLERIRLLIGDKKEVTRDYVSSSTGYDNVSIDGYTYSLSNPKGWPLKVVLDGLSYTTLTDPIVIDFQYLTFSGSAITTSGTLDLWYHHFRFSDSEILQAYHTVSVPPCLDPDDVTVELAAVLASLDLLTAELRLYGINSATEIEIYQEIRINPKGGLDSRAADLQKLAQLRDKLIEDILACAVTDNGVSGVLID
jgi:hypothetical protein